MSIGLTTAAYVVAAILFILALGGLSNQEKAKRAIWYGIIGMILAIIATVSGPGVGNIGILVVMVVVGGVGGWFVAKKVQMTQMPELVAGFHSLVGLAAVFIGINTHLLMERALAANADGTAKDLLGFAATIAKKTPVEIGIMKVELFLGILIGAITFTGSIVAYGKLAGRIDGKALILPGRHLLNAVMVIACIALLLMYMNHYGSWTLYAMTIIALLLGMHLVYAIGGADMPVVVSMLNSYSGWAAAAMGFTLGNDLLIVVGALVGASGAILSYIMCRGMNRSFASVILGGWGGDAGGPQQEVEGEMVPTNVENTVQLLEDADSVVFVPGYGLAVAQAQGAVSELTKKLIAKGKTVRFAIHPVAGRLPGHMNVLLAEAKVPYDYVLEMEEINDDFPSTDFVMILGANDIVNPAAQDDPNSPIAGMPVLEVWKAKNVVISKRGQGRGYSGVENPLFFKDNSRMLYGDAKDSLDAILKQMD
jgi:NAD(P) transhydrogenase subunit beta